MSSPEPPGVPERPGLPDLQHRTTLDVAADEVPMALWDLHRDMPVGATAGIHLGTAIWPPGRLDDVIVGAGFEVLVRTGSQAVQVRRLRTLADTVGPQMRLLLVGLNPSLHAADSGVGFSGPSNRGWPALLGSGLALIDRDPLAMLRDQRVGMTDLVKRATARADELDPAEYASGLTRLDGLCSWLRPAAVCVVGLSGWRAAVDRRASAGEQSQLLGGRPVWLMPNPSGLNAHASLEDLGEHLRSAASLADRSPTT